MNRNALNITKSDNKHNSCDKTEIPKVLLDHVYKSYDRKHEAVSDFNLEVYEHEFLVMLGPSGCGKSTILRMIAGLEEITSGNIYMDGLLSNDLAPRNRHIAMVFQNYALYPHMTVYENMAFGLKMRKTPTGEIDRRVREAAIILDIEGYLNRQPRSLSGGERQRVALGRAMVREPEVFLMDEPLSSLDAQLRIQMRAEILKLHQKTASTFIYVTHDQTEAMTMGSRIVVINNGRIQQTDTPQRIYECPANRFVAGFIGSPSMNFFNASLQNNGGGFSLSVNSHILKLKKEHCEALSKKNYRNQAIITGIRPEDIIINGDGEDAIPCRIELAEPAGHEMYVHLQSEKFSFIARIKNDYGIKPGQILRVKPDTGKLHLFDPVTEKNILSAD